MALAGNGRWCWLDPKLGAMHAVAEAARKVACTGATPVAATNCLNFGNPEKPEIMAQLSAAIDGIAEACTALGTPVTGGNVSLYNETKGEGIYPTPVIGIVGLLEDVSKAVPSGFQAAGHTILSLRCGINRVRASIATQRRPYETEENLQEFGSSDYVKTIFGEAWGMPPSINLEDEALLHRGLAALAAKGLIHSACDTSDGGLLVALAKASIASGVGADIYLSEFESSWPPNLLYGEGVSVLITTSDPDAVEKLLDEQFSIDVFREGVTGGDFLVLRAVDQTLLSTHIEELRAAYASPLESQLAAEVVTA
jgi:phosphoribosylformylglycinamidine synthase